MDLGRLDVLLHRAGPEAVQAALVETGGPLVAAAHRAVARGNHLLGPLVPAHARTDALLCQLATVDALRPLVAQYVATLPAAPRLSAVRLPVRRALCQVITVPDPRTNAWETALGFAADGTWLAVGALDGTVRICDVATAQVRAVLTGHADAIICLAVAPDGGLLASSAEDAVRIWDAATGELRTVLTDSDGDGDHDGDVECMVFAPDGDWLAVGTESGAIRIHDTVTGRTRAVITGHADGVGALVVAPDGAWVASGSRDGTVRVWDTATGEQRAVLTGFCGDTVNLDRKLVVAPDGSWLAFAGNDGTVQLFDPVGGTVRDVLPASWKAGSVTGIAAAADGTWLATSSTDWYQRTWEPDGEVRRELRGRYGWMRGVAIVLDDTCLITVQDVDRHVEVWDLSTDAESWCPADHLGDLHDIAVTPDRRRYVAVTNPSPGLAHLEVWDIAAVLAQRDEPSDEVYGLVTNAGGTWFPVLHDGLIRLYDARTGDLYFSPEVGLRWGASDAWLGDVAPDRRWLAVTGDDPNIQIWDVATGTVRAVLDEEASRYTGVAAAPDSSWLVTWTAGTWGPAVVHVWDSGTGDHRATLTVPGGGINDLAIAPDGTWLATACRDGRIRLKDVRTGRTRRLLSGHTDEVRAVAVAPDGSWLASSGSDRTVRIWDAETGASRPELPGHPDPVTSVAVAPDGTWLATVDDHGWLRIWHASSATLATAIRVDVPATYRCGWLHDGSGICVNRATGGGAYRPFVYGFDPG